MSTERSNRDPRITEGVAELQQLVTSRYPGALFRVDEGDDPDGTYLRATVDVEDTDEVMDLVVDRLVTLQVDHALPLYFIPLRPAEKEMADVKAHSSRGRKLRDRLLKVAHFLSP